LRQSNVLPPITHWVNQLSTAVGLVEAGLGLALMAHYTAQHVRRPQFVVRPLVEPEVIGRVSLMTLTHREQSPQIRLLHDALTDTLRSRAQVLAGGG
jgi:DNA-binding transcriptional LysR family regulator